jgi:hypothetical protein
MSTLGVAAAAHPALAQPLIPPTPSAPGLDQLLSNPGAWLTGMFNDALQALASKTTGDVVTFLDWLLGDGNVISRTPAELTYANPAVTSLSGLLVRAADVGLGVVTVWSGVNLMINPHIRAPYHGALELVPRVLLSGVMIHTSLGWGQFVIDLNNAICQTIGGAAMPAWSDLQQLPSGGNVLLNLIAMVIYLVLGLMLLGQMLMRIALVDVLLAIAPLALLCWVVPQTNSWARLWFTTFFGTVFVQSIQVVVLRLGADMILRLPQLLSSLVKDPLNNANVWLTTLLLGMAVLQLARKIPRFMPGVPAGMGVAYAGPNVLQLRTLFISGNSSRGSK